jgi:hypothetical protein
MNKRDPKNRSSNYFIAGKINVFVSQKFKNAL